MRGVGDSTLGEEGLGEGCGDGTFREEGLGEGWGIEHRGRRVWERDRG